MRRCEIVDGDAFVIGKVLRLLRPSVCSKVGGAGAYDVTDRTDTGGDHAAVWQGADTDCSVDIFLKQVDNTVTQHQPQVNLGVGTGKLQGYRQQVHVSKGRGRGDSQVALGDAILP